MRMMNKCRRSRDCDVLHTHIFSHTDQVVLTRLWTKLAACRQTRIRAHFQNPRDINCRTTIAPLDQTCGSRDLSPPPEDSYNHLFLKLISQNEEDFRNFLKILEQKAEKGAA